MTDYASESLGKLFEKFQFFLVNFLTKRCKRYVHKVHRDLYGEAAMAYHHEYSNLPHKQVASCHNSS